MISGKRRTSLASFHSLGLSSSMVVSLIADRICAALTFAVRAIDLKHAT